MGNLFKAFLFKLKRDLTFRITLFIGLGFAILMTLIYFFIDMALVNNPHLPEGIKLCTGSNLLITSFSPTQNYGLVVPVNLVSFTVLEFTQGTIRNKIIAGNSKAKIYVSLFVSGIVFTILLMGSYALLCLGLGSIFGGFDPNGMTMAGIGFGKMSVDYIWKMIVMSLAIYIFISSMTIFFATLFRNIGPCIPVVILIIIALYMIASLLPELVEESIDVLRIVDPLYGLNAASIDSSTQSLHIENVDFIACIINNLVLSISFFVGGIIIFKHRDVK